MASPTDVLNGEEELPAGPRLRALAGELVRLQPSRTGPESYFVTKDRIVTELRRLSRQVDQGARLARRHPRWTFHFTPTSCSWANAVEGFFATLTRRRLQRGVFCSLVDLQAAIKRYLSEHNRKPKPFVWTPTPTASSKKSIVDTECWRQTTSLIGVLRHQIDAILAQKRAEIQRAPHRDDGRLDLGRSWRRALRGGGSQRGGGQRGGCRLDHVRLWRWGVGSAGFRSLGI
jgi:transposase